MHVHANEKQKRKTRFQIYWLLCFFSRENTAIRRFINRHFIWLFVHLSSKEFVSKLEETTYIESLLPICQTLMKHSFVKRLYWIISLMKPLFYKIDFDEMSFDQLSISKMSKYQNIFFSLHIVAVTVSHSCLIWIWLRRISQIFCCFSWKLNVNFLFAEYIKPFPQSLFSQSSSIEALLIIY
jgi:hypothetical protein